MHYTLHRVALREPFRNKPMELIGTSRADLLRQIRLRVNFLDAEYRQARLPAILNTCLYALLIILDIMFFLIATYAATIFIWIVATAILILVTTLYRLYIPSGQVSLAQVYYCWRCREIWRIELARRTAADER
jgi:ABC-type transport system involved in cytochrome bd biosynthesis fused ATPase/permease subunit